jgi:hypothetical protein
VPRLKPRGIKKALKLAKARLPTGAPPVAHEYYGAAVRGLDAVLCGDVPPSLASSAVAAATALLEQANPQPTRLELTGAGGGALCITIDISGVPTIEVGGSSTAAEPLPATQALMSLSAGRLAPQRSPAPVYAPGGRLQRAAELKEQAGQLLEEAARQTEEAEREQDVRRLGPRPSKADCRELEQRQGELVGPLNLAQASVTLGAATQECASCGHEARYHGQFRGIGGKGCTIVMPRPCECPGYQPPEGKAA